MDRKKCCLLYLHSSHGGCGSDFEDIYLPESYDEVYRRASRVICDIRGVLPVVFIEKKLSSLTTENYKTERLIQCTAPRIEELDCCVSAVRKQMQKFRDKDKKFQKNT